MLFVVTGMFRADVDPEPASLQAQFNDHLQQTVPRIRLAGYLRDAANRRIGFMGLVEAPDHDLAAAFLRDSPYQRAGLYERIVTAEFDVEIGRLDR